MILIMTPKYKIIEKEVRGEVYIEEDSQYNNIRASKVVVKENVQVRLFGSIDHLVVCQGARVFLHGTLNGKAENYGELHVY